MREDRRKHYDDGFRREALEPVKAGAVYRKVSKGDSSFFDILPRMNAGDSRISRFGFLFATTRQEGRGR